MGDMSLELQIVTIIAGFILPLLYLFLLPGLFEFILKPYPAVQKGLQIFLFFFLPLLAPIGIMLWVGFWIFKAIFSVFLIFMLALAYLFYWISLYFPFGGVFKAWVKIAGRILRFFRKKVELFMGLSFPSLDLVLEVNS
jgi:hypothetical protein